MLTLTNIFGNLRGKKITSARQSLPTPNRMVEEYVTHITAQESRNGLYSLKVRTLKKSPPGEDGITSLVTIHNYCNAYSLAQASKIVDDFKLKTAKGFSDVSFIDFNTHLKNLGVSAWYNSHYPFMGIGVLEMHGASSYASYRLSYSGNVLMGKFLKEMKFFYFTVLLMGKVALVSAGISRSI